jgi:xylogalacturonan beta-1,3-xylosyltransferase
MAKTLKQDDVIIKNATSELKLFRRLMLRSWFALCPRGFGPASFRIYEALQLGCIPVIISDKYRYPYADEVDWSEFSVHVREHDIKRIPKILAGIGPNKRLKMINAGLSFHKNYCTKQAVCEKIISNISHRTA